MVCNFHLIHRAGYWWLVQCTCRSCNDKRYSEKLDQGALGMSDPCGTLPLALKPNAVPRINCLLSNFYFCANWSVVPCQMIGLEGPVWGGGYMPRRRRLYANCQLPVELILYELRPNSPGGGYMPTTKRRRLYANWYSTNSDLTVPAEVICQQQYGGGYMPIANCQLNWYYTNSDLTDLNAVSRSDPR